MKQFIAITILMYVAFLIEFVLYNTFGVWGKPELMVLAVVFCSLYWGIRHSIWAAFVSGMLKDAFSIEPFGTYLFVYIVAAYLTTLVRNNLYQPGSRFSRIVVTFIVLVGIFTLEAFLHMRFYEVRLWEAVCFVFVPRIVLTMAVATFAFGYLRELVGRFKL